MKPWRLAPAIVAMVAFLAGLLLGVAVSAVAQGVGEPTGREHAARQFIAIVAPGQEMRARCVRAETMLEEDESPAALDEATSCLAAYAAVSRDVAERLRSAHWPTDAVADVERLAAVTSARAGVLQRASEVSTFDAYWSQRIPDDDASADIVATRLGLPTRAAQ